MSPKKKPPRTGVAPVHALLAAPSPDARALKDRNRAKFAVFQYSTAEDVSLSLAVELHAAAHAARSLLLSCRGDAYEAVALAVASAELAHSHSDVPPDVLERWRTALVALLAGHVAPPPLPGETAP